MSEIARKRAYLRQVCLKVNTKHIIIRLCFLLVAPMVTPAQQMLNFASLHAPYPEHSCTRTLAIVRTDQMFAGNYV